MKMSRVKWKPERPDLLRNAIRYALRLMIIGAVALVSLLVLVLILAITIVAWAPMLVVWIVILVFVMITGIRYYDEKLSAKYR